MSTRSLYVAMGALSFFHLQVRGLLVTAGFVHLEGLCVVLGAHLLALVFTTRFVVLVGR